MLALLIRNRKAFCYEPRALCVAARCYFAGFTASAIIHLYRAGEGIVMRWTQGGRSEDLEDRRDEGGGGAGGFGGIRLGIGGTIIILLLSLLFKRDFCALLGWG